MTFDHIVSAKKSYSFSAAVQLPGWSKGMAERFVRNKKAE